PAPRDRGTRDVGYRHRDLGADSGPGGPTVARWPPARPVLLRTAPGGPGAVARRVAPRLGAGTRSRGAATRAARQPGIVDPAGVPTRIPVPDAPGGPHPHPDRLMRR